MYKNELRRYRRIPLDLPARIVVNTIDEYEGRLVNISPGDLAIKAETKATVGDACVVSITGLDVIEGRVARVMPDGFALSFMLSKKRRTILVEQLMLRANAGHAEGLKDRRSTPRHFVGEQRMACRLPDGTSLFVKILDRSVDGVSVDSPRRPAVGCEIWIGRTRGVVMRHTLRGFVAVYEPGGLKSPAPRLRAVQS
ncbi:MAG: PilZ domain-containing protein [Parvularculaceae bacterium]